MQGALIGKTMHVVCASFVIFSLKSSTQLYNHYRIIVEDNSVKYVPLDGFFGIQILPNSISVPELTTLSRHPTFGLQRLARSRPPCLTTFRPPVHSELSLYLCLQFLISVVTVAICFSRFSDCCVSLVRFLLRLDGPNRFSGHFQQDCLGTLPHSVLPLSHKPVGHLCCKLYCFLFLKFLEIQRRNAFTLTP